MRTLLIVGSVVLSLIGSVPMTVQILRGSAKPRAVSWGLWAGIDTIGGAAALAAHQLPAAAFALACSAECVLVAVLALRTPRAERDQPVAVPLIGGWKVRLDLVCLAGGLAGLVLLAAVRAPGPALAATVATDLIAYIPTLVHMWQRPGEEVASSYAAYAVAAGLTLAAAAVAGDMRIFTAIAYAGYLLVADGAGASMIVARRRAARIVPSPWPPAVHHDLLDGDWSEPGRAGQAGFLLVADGAGASMIVHHDLLDGDWSEPGWAGQEDPRSVLNGRGRRRSPGMPAGPGMTRWSPGRARRS